MLGGIALPPPAMRSDLRRDFAVLPNENGAREVPQRCEP